MDVCVDERNRQIPRNLHAHDKQAPPFASIILAFFLEPELVLSLIALLDLPVVLLRGGSGGLLQLAPPSFARPLDRFPVLPFGLPFGLRFGRQVGRCLLLLRSFSIERFVAKFRPGFRVVVSCFLVCDVGRTAGVISLFQIFPAALLRQRMQLGRQRWQLSHGNQPFGSFYLGSVEGLQRGQTCNDVGPASRPARFLVAFALDSHARISQQEEFLQAATRREVVNAFLQRIQADEIQRQVQLAEPFQSAPWHLNLRDVVQRKVYIL
mmetsp:Transcript_30489/g.72532  ORF Transcript_30489/g.72532 Transcript_30489/m.72532 type:complete len:266 (+) Transcript_30489:448-1245(+)